MNSLPALQDALRTRVCDELEASIAAGCSKRRTVPRDVSRVLLHYWIELPSRPEQDRAALLDRIVQRMCAGELSRQALVPFALGDTAHRVVASAVTHYVGHGLVSIDRRNRLVHDAIEWVRRGLALNRAAVFAALLATGDEEILARLGALRLLLDASEVNRVYAQFDDECRPAINVFLADWRDL